MKRFALLGLISTCVGCASTSRQQPIVLMEPHEGKHLWVFPESKDNLGTGGELQIYVDAETHPEAKASLAKFTLGVGGALPIHRHEKTEEMTYFLSGIGVVISVDGDGNEVEVPISSGHVWYNPPGAWHAVKNTGTTPLSMVFTTIPNEKKGLLSFFRQVCVGPGKEGLPISEAELQRLGRAHDLIFRGSLREGNSSHAK
jgi:mannose-6-phosphate isomerase-like protein (cupin superfamily)